MVVLTHLPSSLVEKNISKEDAIKNADNLLYEKAKLVIKDLNKA